MPYLSSGIASAADTNSPSIIFTSLSSTWLMVLSPAPCARATPPHINIPRITAALFAMFFSTTGELLGYA